MPALLCLQTVSDTSIYPDAENRGELWPFPIPEPLSTYTQTTSESSWTSLWNIPWKYFLTSISTATTLAQGTHAGTSAS